MNAYSKPLPIPSTLARPFWDALRAGELRLQNCRNCGRFNHPPKIVCPRCHGRDFEWKAVEPRGTIYSYTIVHRAPIPAFKAEVPYAVALVDIAGTEVRLLASLAAPLDQISVGLPVTVEFDHVTEEFSLFRFRPDFAEALK